MASNINFLLKCKSWYAKLLFAFFMTVFYSHTLYAYDFEVDGIYYDINEDGNSVSVTHDDRYSGDYSGNIVIPSTVTYETIVYNVTSIGEDAFSWCSSFTSISIPEGVTRIGDAAFLGCTSLTYIIIPNSVISIGRETFGGCSSLTSITIPNNVRSIGKAAFGGCSSLTSITIPNGVRSIGESAFYDCESLISIEIPNSVISIGEEAFWGCKRLNDITILDGESTLKLSDMLFVESSIENLYLGRNISYDYPPFSSTSLKTITIGNNVTSIEDYAFSDCKNLNDITILDGESTLQFSTDVFIGSTIENLYLGRNISYPSYEPPFAGTTLQTVTIGNNVTSIGDLAFCNCKKLNDIAILDGESTLHFFTDVFGDCNIENLYLGRNISYDDPPFSFTSLKTTTIGNSVTNISQDTFWRCSSLKTFYCNNTQLTTLDVSELSALTVLLCYNNKFNTLDISKNMELKHLDCSDNKLTELDITHNPALTWLYCHDNKLTFLDVSQNSELRHLHCNDNQLATLNISKNAELIEIYCHNNKLQGSSMDAFINSLPINTTDEVHILRVMTDEEGEGNVCTKAQVAAIKAKGWTPYWKSNGEWIEYAGSIEGYEINEENFPDDNFRNYLLQQPYGEDEFLYFAEIDDITYMDVSGRNISSLQGIEYFTALMQLLCDNNKLTTLDVSQNTELTHLGCDSNQLTALNVSENTKLIWLYCHSNKLAALDVSNNTELRYLHCYDNQLTSLDVSRNTELKSLECYNNNISGYAMDTFISSLPMNTGSEPQPLRLLTDDMDEGNSCTMEQAQAFKAKGWTPMVRIDGVWVEYEEATAISNPNAEAENDDNAEYYTLDGVRIEKPTKKGIYIKNGKKVIIK